MNRPVISQWLVRLIIAVALPAVACFGYYSIGNLGEEQSFLALPVMLAYPMALVGFIGLVRMLLSEHYSRLKLWLWSLCIAVPVMILLMIRA